jgi:hypothetical protein
MKEFKFFQKNRFKDKCRLQVGMSFIFRGYYCIVSRMYQNDFEFLVQEIGHINSLSYEEYLKTPSAAGRELNRW